MTSTFICVIFLMVEESHYNFCNLTLVIRISNNLSLTQKACFIFHDPCQKYRKTPPVFSRLLFLCRIVLFSSVLLLLSTLFFRVLRQMSFPSGGDANVDENSQQHFIKHIVCTLLIFEHHLENLSDQDSKRLEPPKFLQCVA